MGQYKQWPLKISSVGRLRDCSTVGKEPEGLTLIASAEKTELSLACMTIRVEGIEKNHGGGFIPHSHFSWCCY